MDEEQVRRDARQLEEDVLNALKQNSATRGTKLAVQQLLRSLASAGLLLRSQSVPLDLDQLRALEAEIPQITKSTLLTHLSWTPWNLRRLIQSLVSTNGSSKIK